MKTLNRITVFGILLVFAASLISCGEETVPKPGAYLRLDYPLGTNVSYSGECPYTFDYNSLAKVTDKGNCNLTIQYPKMKATLFLTYKNVEGNNLEVLLRDAQKLTYEHVIKADEILERPYINPEKKVYGMFYQVGGNAATNAQFYVTDSTRHFLTGSMYFYARPNFDSILPAASYIKEDMQNLVESIRWK